jgi:hypothetical protein
VEALRVALGREVAKELDDRLDFFRQRRPQSNGAAIAEDDVGWAREQLARVRSLVDLGLGLGLSLG